MQIHQNMHRILSLVFLLTFTTSIIAQERQKVYSLVKQHQETSWYKTQYELWKAFIADNPKDGDAWLNCYTAYRMMKIYRLGPTQDSLNALVEEMGKAIPESFEYNYVAYWNGGNGTDPKEILTTLQDKLATFQAKHPGMMAIVNINSMGGRCLLLSLERSMKRLIRSIY